MHPVGHVDVLRVKRMTLATGDNGYAARHALHPEEHVINVSKVINVPHVTPEETLHKAAVSQAFRKVLVDAVLLCDV